MRRKILIVLAVLLGLALCGVAVAEDPFAAGEDALAVADSDGSSSLRAKIKLKKMLKDMIQVKVISVDDSKFPDCVVTGRVLKAAKKKGKHFKLLGRGKTYKFLPQYQRTKKKGKVVLKDEMNQNNLGACYYPPKSRLVLRISGVDLKAKVFLASEVYLRK